MTQKVFGKVYRAPCRGQGPSREIDKLPGHLVCALIVSYNPPREILGNIAAIRSQVDSVLVVDNGSSEQNLAMLRRACYPYDFELIENGCNRGIAAALNVGIRELKARGYFWSALFDQDSTAEPGFIDFMLQASKDASDAHPVGIVCAALFDRQTGISLPNPRSKKGEILAAMTSGTLIPLNLFDQLGTFNEPLFIDYVDIEFSLRIRKAGYRIVQSPRAVLRHSWGSVTRRRMLWRWVATSNHSAARRYYMTRNRLWVLGQFFQDWSWSLNEIKAIVRETLIVVLLERDRAQKLKNISRGFIDALSGRMGKRFEL